MLINIAIYCVLRINVSPLVLLVRGHDHGAAYEFSDILFRHMQFKCLHLLGRDFFALMGYGGIHAAGQA